MGFRPSPLNAPCSKTSPLNAPCSKTGQKHPGPQAKELLGVIDRNFGTLAFCRRFLDRLGCKQVVTPTL